MQNIQTLIQAAKSPRSMVREPDHLNREGAPSFFRSLKEQVVQVLVTGTLGDTFYATGGQLASEAMEVLVRARTECPEYLARAVVYAREQGYLKTLPVLGLAVLSGGRGRTKSLFEASFPRVIRTPDDLRAFTTLCRSGVVPGRKGLGGMAADAVRAHLDTISEYHAVKYGSAASREVALRDVIRMAHPRPSTPAMAERFGWLVGGAEKLGSDPALNPRIRAFEALKRAATEDEAIALIREGGLPYEVVIPSVKAATPRIWSELLRQAPYMNLLRNLVAFTRHGVFQDEANVRYAVDRLTDQRAIERSMVLPFRFFDAWRRYGETEGHDSRVADSIRVALERSFVNLPSLGDRTVCIGTDVSASMDSPVSQKGTTRFIDIAGIFTGALLRKCEGRTVPLPFDTGIRQDCSLSSRDDILVTASKIAGLQGGGTAVGAPVEYLLQRKLKVDTFIGITDCEDWAYGREGYGYGCSASFLDLWRRYRNEVAPEAKAFLVTIAPYRDAVAPSGEPGVRFIYGWSDRVPGYIAKSLATGESQVAEIEAMQLCVAAGSAEADVDLHSDDAEQAESE